MKLKSAFRIGLVVFSFPSVLLANEIGVGRDDDTPGAQPQPPAETESATTESLLQQILEWFDVSDGQ